MNNIIGISGKIGSGKSELVRVLRFEGFLELNFSTKLKEAVALIFDVSLDRLYSRVGKETVDERWGLSPRFMLQRLGTEVGRNLHPDVWIYHVAKTCTAFKENLKYVIGDVRFENEYKFVLSIGGVMWRIERPNSQEIEPNESNHVSETEVELLPHHAFIANSGTLEELEKKVKLLLYK